VYQVHNTKGWGDWEIRSTGWGSMGREGNDIDESRERPNMYIKGSVRIGEHVCCNLANSVNLLINKKHQWHYAPKEET